ncbi:ankyrin repeat domain-containing protein 45 isoform X3 [Fukomys damarensis]|uniref:ankyrin repeat domain-containing protein 45 isoform X3 n=1 Tax=Fukomys damarensis TaxID=885580 RepID=UPI001455327C|nr:ankyrin repeat domain-containing protein 45 isoform X3 [Fukomys damarensis]
MHPHVPENASIQRSTIRLTRAAKQRAHLIFTFYFLNCKVSILQKIYKMKKKPSGHHLNTLISIISMNSSPFSAAAHRPSAALTFARSRNLCAGAGLPRRALCRHGNRGSGVRRAVFLELMEPEAQLESESSEKSLCFSQEEEKEESQEPEETGIENPLVKPALTGDIEGLQKIFEDPENPHHKDAMQLLLEEDTIGRNLLYAACMAGQSDVIRALAKYGVNLNEKTARDARLALKKYIAKVSLTITDSEKGPGRLLKEDKNTILNACRVKNEWLETHPEASINELFEQRQNLEDIVTPIFTKMATSRQAKLSNLL